MQIPSLLKFVTLGSSWFKQTQHERAETKALIYKWNTCIVNITIALERLAKAMAAR
jgi:hypothetical protein